LRILSRFGKKINRDAKSPLHVIRESGLF
jgi:hypothetical protein